ncbi:hypothetical protein C8R44DRAFT_547135, partial [Mycena epipterygia]
LAQYDTAIEALKETFRGTLADRMNLQEYVDGCRGVLAPVRRLPPEILCEIFMAYSSPSTQARTPADEKKKISKSDVLLVSHVCTQWRIIALGTPRLWSDIAVDVFNWPRDPAPFLQVLRKSLERGAGHPLTLSVGAGTVD